MTSDRTRTQKAVRTRTSYGRSKPRDRPAKAKGVRTKPPKDRRVQRHEAIWLDGRVPHGYWDRPGNRRLYVRWLGQKLGFRKPEDWYRISTDDFKRNAGGFLLNKYWSASAINAVMECFPDYDWKEWLFTIAPRHFWQDPDNHRRYMKWLGQQLGIRRPADWYRVTVQDFKDHKGEAFLIHYNSTFSAAIKAFLPGYDWKEWMFYMAPLGFWQERKNRRRYMLWLGKELGFEKIDDWYSVTGGDFVANYGNQCLKTYFGSPIAALRDCFPRHTWHEWMFTRVPVDFWNSKENRQRYMRWLGKRLGFRKPEDWSRVRRDDFRTNYGASLLARYRSYHDLVKECAPAA